MTISLPDYLQNPCGASSIPWWKHLRITVPNHMRIIHQRDFDPILLADCTDECYFRLLHPLKRISAILPDWLCIRTAEPADVPLMAEIINASYTDITVTPAQLEGYTRTPVYAPDLWIIAYDRQTGAPVGCGIADLDRTIGEGMLEWIQVLPEYRRRHAGRAIVSELLRRMQGKAAFATVSGKTDSASNPEALYRDCGFTGGDLWHVLTVKDAAR